MLVKVPPGYMVSYGDGVYFSWCSGDLSVALEMALKEPTHNSKDSISDLKVLALLPYVLFTNEEN